MGFQQADKRSSTEDVFGYLPAIDGLRAIAVLSVIIYHLNAALLPGGFVGVDVFFVISGFVVTGSLMGMNFDRVRDLLTYFYARRLVRIMPALITMLIVTIILSNLFVPKAWLSKSMGSVATAAFFGISNITLALETDTYFAPEAAFNPFIHTWSLGVEEQFYLIFPFLFFWYAVGRSRPAKYPNAITAIGLLSLLSVAICAWLMQTEPRHAFYMIPARFWELGIGMMLCLTRHRWIGALGGIKGRWVPIALSALSAALILFSFTIHEVDGFPFPLAIPPTLGTAGLIVAVCTWRHGALSALLSSPPFVTIGKLSYSLYLWHWPVFVLFRWTVGLETVLTAAIAFMLVFVLGWMSYRFIETPTRYNVHLKALSRPAVVGLSLAFVLVSAGMGAVLLKGQSRMSLSQTADTALWYADGRKPLWLTGNCALDAEDEILDLGTVTTWTPRDCTSITGRRVVAVGDSHGLAYSPLLRQFAADTGNTVQLWYARGCGFLQLNKPISSHDDWCKGYYDGMRARLQKELRPGDILFLPNLRLKRFTEQTGADAGAIEVIPGLPGDEAARRKLAVDEAVQIIAEFQKTGATIVFEAPLPLFRAPPFRCSDWFNRHNPMCEGGLMLTRTEFDTLRAPILQALTSIAIQVGGPEIWDPASKLCSRSGCNAMRNGKPLFFDGDHLSGYGNEALYPHFRDFMQSRVGSAS